MYFFFFFNKSEGPIIFLVMSLVFIGMKLWKCFYLTSHSTHFIYGYMVKDHSDSEKGNPLPPHRLLFPVNSKGSFICNIPHRQDSTYHGICYTSRGALAGYWNE